MWHRSVVKARKCCSGCYWCLGWCKSVVESKSSQAMELWATVDCLSGGQVKEGCKGESCKSMSIGRLYIYIVSSFPSSSSTFSPPHPSARESAAQGSGVRQARQGTRGAAACYRRGTEGRHQGFRGVIVQIPLPKENVLPKDNRLIFGKIWYYSALIDVKWLLHILLRTWGIP